MMQIVNILLVEDDKLDQTEVERTLDRRNILCRLRVARNGEEALDVLRETERTLNFPDIALIDLNMPKMNGFELIEAIRKEPQWSRIKIFVLTTSDEKADKIEAEKFGVSGFITKPLKLNSPSSKDAFNLMMDLMNNR
ncbi:MAG TPA: response regulator [Ohtaekwangia sp.]|jgi:CheY-like chemotaxis protein